jgi:hypothetical protein
MVANLLHIVSFLLELTKPHLQGQTHVESLVWAMRCF